MLYIAIAKAQPIIPWDETMRGIHTEPLSSHDEGVAAQFHHPNVCYIGSDTQCGCGFRNATYQNGCWPEEEWMPEGDTRPLTSQPNHQRLVEFIQKHLPGEESIELYGTWEADFSAPALSDQRIPLTRLLEIDFYFRDRGRYVVEIRKAQIPKED